MNGQAQPDTLQDVIGYRFHDAQILESALASRAAHAGNPAGKKTCTEPLATVGDAILDAVVACRLYEEMQAGDNGARIPAADEIKSGWSRSFAERHSLRHYIPSPREQTLEDIWRTGKKPAGKATEAVLGAVFIDAERHGSNGFEAVKTVLAGLGYY